jgi:hypothetical protein
VLDNLDKVDWASLSHAYGKADDVPHLLRMLASKRKKDRESALYDLFGNIWHQGTVYEATAYAVPFLIELLTSPKVLGKDGILTLLENLGAGHSYLKVHQNLYWYHNERHQPEFIAQMQRELGWVGAAHLGVVAGTPTYLQLLQHSDAAIRLVVPDTLAVCVERYHEIGPVILARVDVEPDPKVRQKKGADPD